MSILAVRPGEKKDCQSVLNLILQKSKAENRRSDVTISLTGLQKDGFDINPSYFHSFVAESSNGEILGFAMFYHRYSTWESKGLHLRCLVVDEAISNATEVKEKLVRALCKFGVDDDFCRVSFRELASNTSELKLHQKLGAVNLSKEEGWLLFCFPPSSVQKILKDTEEIKDRCPNVIVRWVEREDCKDIAQLIKELAEFEKMGDEAKLTGEDLVRDCFDDPNKHFRAFVAEDKENKEVVGFALFFNAYKEFYGKSFHLEDLYVTPKFRKGGVGQKLFAAVAKVSNDENYHGFTLECLDWNTPAIKFYEKNHGHDLTSQRGINCCRYRRDAMKALI